MTRRELAELGLENLVGSEALKAYMHGYFVDNKLYQRAKAVANPSLYEDYRKHRKEYGYIMRLGSHVFFHGLAVGETNKVNIADGKTLVIKYLGLGEVDKEGMRTVSFELNGIRRDVQVPDEAAQKNIVKVPMADPEDKSQVGSSIPGAVSKIAVKVGDTVEKNQTLVTIEAMKMETAITARMSGTVSEILVKEGETVKGGQLILVIK